MASFASVDLDKRMLGVRRDEKAASGAKESFFRTRFHGSMAQQLEEDKREDRDDAKRTEGKDRDRKSAGVVEVVGRRTGLSMARSLGVMPMAMASEATAIKSVARERVVGKNDDGGAASSPSLSKTLIAPSATFFRRNTTRVKARKAQKTPRRADLVVGPKVRTATASSGTPRLPAKASAPASAPASTPAQGKSRVSTKKWTTLASQSSPGDSCLKGGTWKAPVTGTAGWAFSDVEWNSGASTFGTAVEEIRLSAPGVLFEVTPERARGRAAIVEPLTLQPEDAWNAERSARGGRGDTKGAVVTGRAMPDKRRQITPHSYFAVLKDPQTGTNSEGTEPKTRRHSLSPDIDSIYAAVASGVPEAVPAVLRCIRDDQAVEELTARNGRRLVESHKSSVFVFTPRDSGVVGDFEGIEGGGGFSVGGASEGKDCEELETLVMLAAHGGNLKMTDAVLHAIREKLQNEEQIASVLEARDEDGRSLVASAAEGGSSAILQRVLTIMGGEAAVAGGMSAKEAGYFIKVAARSGTVEVFKRVIKMMAQNDKLVVAMDMAVRICGVRASVFVEAASSGSGEMVDAVTAAMFESLTERTVECACSALNLLYFRKRLFSKLLLYVIVLALILHFLRRLMLPVAAGSISGYRSVDEVEEPLLKSERGHFRAVYHAISTPPASKVVGTILACGVGPMRTTALLAAAESKSAGAVRAVLKVLKDISGGGNGNGNGEENHAEEEKRGTSPETRASPLAARTPSVPPASQSKNRDAVTRPGGTNTRNSPPSPGSQTVASKKYRPPEEEGITRMIMAKNERGVTALSCAASSDVLDIVVSIVDVMTKFLPISQITEACTSSFSMCCANLSTTIGDERLGILAYLLQHGARPPRKGLLRLSNCVRFPRLKESLLGAVSSAHNPFIPGMNLSVACTVAAKRALEGDKRRMSLMQAAVDELLLEIMEQMPQTVMGFKGEMKDCAAIFEPEYAIHNYRGCQGPLSVALTHRQQMETYCTTPLILDYMACKFTRGLPSFTDREGLLLNMGSITGPGKMIAGDDLLTEGRVLFFGMFPQTGYGEETLSSITYFPGARFIITGLLSRPGNYFKVPALRMALDLVTYLAMMVNFAFVILHRSQPFFDWTEIVFTTYILGAILTEIRDMCDNSGEYMRDKWNVLDVASLILFVIGVIFRAFGGVGDTSSRACYALGAPLAIARILYFAQVLPSQGPMIQIIFSMASLLVKFGFVMLVVVSGFAISFFSLFRDRQTYGEVWQSLFKAMLGDTEYFDELSGTKFDRVATVLLVAYLIILTIMMLNLLVAVLSTAHAKVDMNADLEYKVTKARLIQHYVKVVKIGRLPPPFNLIQWVVTLPFMAMDCCYFRCARVCSSLSSSSSPYPSSPPSFISSSSSSNIPCSSFDPTSGIRTSNTENNGLVAHIRNSFGRTVFWVMMGPIAVCSGWALWTASVVKAPLVVWETSGSKPLCGRITRVLLAIATCTVGAPLWLLIMWPRGGMDGLWNVACVLFGRCCGYQGQQGAGEGDVKVPRRRQSKLAVRTEGGGDGTTCASWASPAAAGTAAAGGRSGDASDKVVASMLQESEGALKPSELQFFLHDPMSDPDVRRDEETRTTTVEHIKLLRNRLEATNKENMEELRACLVRTTGDISCRLDRAGLSLRRAGALAEAAARGVGGGGGGGGGGGTGNDACDDGDYNQGVGGPSPSLAWDEISLIVNDRLNKLEERLEARASVLEERMGIMMEARLDALVRNLGAS